MQTYSHVEKSNLIALVLLFQQGKDYAHPLFFHLFHATQRSYAAAAPTLVDTLFSELLQKLGDADVQELLHVLANQIEVQANIKQTKATVAEALKELGDSESAVTARKGIFGWLRK